MERRLLFLLLLAGLLLEAPVTTASAVVQVPSSSPSSSPASPPSPPSTSPTIYDTTGQNDQNKDQFDHRCQSDPADNQHDQEARELQRDFDNSLDQRDASTTALEEKEEEEEEEKKEEKVHTHKEDEPRKPHLAANSASFTTHLGETATLDCVISDLADEPVRISLTSFF
ncbi:uncharacterized protein [Procambarus clarkii]|uniref:uncharacterized protein n=1 Tax=Procambarus clarkii TaxID=6728 RepID=UPI0037448C61